MTEDWKLTMISSLDFPMTNHNQPNILLLKNVSWFCDFSRKNWRISATNFDHICPGNLLRGVVNFFGCGLMSIKVKKILKGSLDSITFTFSKNSNYTQEILLFCFQKFVENVQQCFALLPQVNFPTNTLNFHWRWRWRDQIQAILLNLFYF